MVMFFPSTKKPVRISGPFVSSITATCAFNFARGTYALVGAALQRFHQVVMRLSVRLHAESRSYGLPRAFRGKN